jgi:hypothetical protein
MNVILRYLKGNEDQKYPASNSGHGCIRGRIIISIDYRSSSEKADVKKEVLP